MKKTKQIANRTLFFLTIIFLILIFIKFQILQNGWIDFLIFVLEAALIGGIADWFAVTALFKYPLGIKFPHTALIPTNRKKVISSIVTLIKDELLSVLSIKKYISNIKLVNLMIRLIDHQIDFIINKGIEFVIERINKMNHNELGKHVEKIIKQQIKNIPMTTIILEAEKNLNKHQTLDYIWENGIDFIINELPYTNLKQNISQYLWKIREEQLNKYSGFQGFFRRAVISIAEQTNALNINDATNVIYKEIEKTIIELKVPNHPIRLEIERNLYEYLQQFKDNEQWQQEVEVWKNNLVDQLDMHSPLTQFISSLTTESTITKWSMKQLNELWEQFKENEVLQHKVEKYLKSFLFTFIEQEHNKIGSLVEEILQSFTDEDLVVFIEEKVGEDLQWIRINGSLLGMFVGALLYVFLHYIYTPFLNLF